MVSSRRVSVMVITCFDCWFPAVDGNGHYSEGLVSLGGSIKQTAHLVSFADVSLVVYNLGTSFLRRCIVDINRAG